MLGFYENFPNNVHKIAHFSTSTPIKKLQKNLIEVIRKINNETFGLEEIANPSIHDCKTLFEFGIADGRNFNYLSEEEANRLLKSLNTSLPQIMDFFSAIRYYKVNDGKKKPLRFDYYMLRFTFNKKWLEIQVYHEKGPMHMSPEELTNFIAAQVNESFSRRILKPFMT
jgi:hypothetical protein